MKDCKTSGTTASAVDSTDAYTLQGFVTGNTGESATTYSDDARTCNGINRPRESVRHPVSGHVNGMAHTKTGLNHSGHRSSAAIMAPSTKSARHLH